jgi:copper chaperone
MATQRFKTTINCANCLRAVTPALNAEPAITAWQVDTTTPDKILSVDTSLTPTQVAALVEEAGFKAEPLLA